MDPASARRDRIPGFRGPPWESTVGWARPTLVGPILLGLSAVLSVYFAGFQLPGADEGALLTNAMKLLRGGVFYRDVDAYPFPLAAYLAASAFSVFGEHLSVSRALAGLLFCATVLALYATALRLVDRR